MKFGGCHPSAQVGGAVVVGIIGVVQPTLVLLHIYQIFNGHDRDFQRPIWGPDSMTVHIFSFFEGSSTSQLVTSLLIPVTQFHSLPPSDPLLEKAIQ